jgi:hypothetical protein
LPAAAVVVRHPQNVGAASDEGPGQCEKDERSAKAQGDLRVSKAPS